MMPLRTVAILRAFGPGRSQEYAERCWVAGMDLVEVPVQGEAGWASLEAVAGIAGARPFGAGTVLTAEDARRAVELGASVVIAPGTDPSVVEVASRAGALALPGVMTPSDVTTAVRNGLTAVKLFPASVVGPAWVTALKGPFPQVAVIAVGGINLANAAEYLRAGAAGVGFGGSIVEVLEAPDPPGVVEELHALAAG